METQPTGVGAPEAEPPPEPWRPPPILLAVALLVLTMVLQCAGVLGLLAFEKVTEGKVAAGSSAWETALLNLVVIGVVIVLGCLAARRPQRELLPLRGFSPLLVLPILVTLGGVSIVSSEVDNLLWAVLPMPDFVLQAFESMFDGSPAGAFAALVIVAPLTEELLFRGVMLNTLLRRYSPAVAIGISALAFTILHFNPWQVFSPMLAGLLFGWWCWRTRSLWPGLIGHALLNGFVFAFAHVPFPLEIQGYTTELTDGFQHQPLWFDALGLLMLAGGVLGTWGVFRITGERRR